MQLGLHRTFILRQEGAQGTATWSPALLGVLEPFSFFALGAFSVRVTILWLEEGSGTHHSTALWGLSDASLSLELVQFSPHQEYDFEGLYRVTKALRGALADFTRSSSCGRGSTSCLVDRCSPWW